jgi:hypothetical protein
MWRTISGCSIADVISDGIRFLLGDRTFSMIYFKEAAQTLG